MGLISSFCSKSRTQTLQAEEQALINCKICRDKIKSYIKSLEKQERLKKDQAKQELRNNNRDKAKRFLNQSKIFGEQLKVANGQLDMIIEQINQIESAQMKKDALHVLEQGNSILKKLNEEISIDKWEKVSDDMNEMKQQQDEISDFLTNHRIDQNKFDEELNNELAELEKLQNKERENIVQEEFPSIKNKEETREIKRELEIMN